MSDLKKRGIVALGSVFFVGLLFFFASHSSSQFLVALALALLAAAAVWEFEKLAKTKGGEMVLPILLILSGLEVISFFFAAREKALVSGPLLVFFASFLLLFALHFRDKEGAIVDIAVSSFGMLYIAVPLGMILGILYFSGLEDGRWWVAYLLIVTKITDVGAYFAGNLWGQRKLAPRISPGKTWEGAIFGLFCAALASFIFFLLSRKMMGSPRFSLGGVESLCLGLVLGVGSQFGDLSESMLKRDANKKDSNALPGIGGVLDAVDSLLFNAPLIYLYLHYVKR